MDTVTKTTNQGRLERLSNEVRARLATFLSFESMDEIYPDDAFADLGTDSSQAVEFKLVLESMYGLELKTSVLFDCPTVDRLVAMLAERLAELDTDQTTTACFDASMVPSAIVDFGDEQWVHDGESFPLSETQKGLWYIGQSRDCDHSFHVPLLFQLDLHLTFDPKRFDRALQKVATRHPAMRVTIAYDKNTGSLRQTVVSESTIRAIAPLKQTTDVVSAFRRQMRQPMDLAAAPPVESFYAVDQQSTWVLLKLHHIVIDGLSAAPMVGELWREYFTDCEPKPTTNQDAGFFQFIEWETRYLKSSRAEVDRDYWKRMLSGARGEAGLESAPNKLVATHHGEGVQCIHLDLTEAQNESLDELSHRLNCPPSTVLLSLYYLLLWRLSGHNDLTITTPVSGRPGGLKGPFRDKVGCFINLVATRCLVDGEQPFAMFAKSVSERFLESMEHGQLPFSEQLREAGLSIDSPDGRPSFPYSFTYQNIFAAWSKDADWQDHVRFCFDLYQEIEDDLTLEVYDFGDRKRVNWKYQSNRFSDSAIRSWANVFDHLLAQVCADASARVDELSLLCDEEVAKLRCQFDRRQDENVVPITVADWITDVASKIPDHDCVLACEDRLSYGQLAERGKFIAERLRLNGVSAGHVIAITDDRNIETIVSLFGVLTAGAAYLPISSEEPMERRLQMIRAANAIEFDAALKTGGNFAEHAKGVSLSTAYVLFTSGTTGQPKAVPIRHDSLVNLCHAMIDRYQLSDRDVMLQFAPLTFDMSVEEIFPVLCVGGSIVIADENRSASVNRDLIRRHNVTLLNLPPSYHSAIRSAFPRCEEFYQGVRLVAFGGDRLSAETAREVLSAGPRVFNAYGPTEATVNATIAEQHCCEDSNVIVDIGSPVNGIAIAIMRSDGSSLPLGTVGELCLWGRGIADGYIPDGYIADGDTADGDTALQSSSFTRWIFPGDVEPTACYRTGDQARIIDHPSGNGELTIELLGRSDDQINLRGYRIEPREIESCLVSHPGVEAAAVIAIGDRGLAALCVGKANVAGQLASWVAAKLPERMRPSKFRFAERLPLTSRGKLDRTAIAELLMRSSGAEGGDAAMSDASLFRSPLWSDLAAVLEETLELESVHPAERFVEIGGHSLLAIIITAKLSDRFGVDLQLRDFVAVDRLGELADVIENLRVSQRVDDKGDLKKLPKNERLMIDSAPLTPQQQRLWILEQLGQGDSYVIPAIAEVEGELDAERLTQALDWIRQRHEALQLSIETTAEGPIQRFDSTAKVPFESRKFSDHSTAREWIDQCAKKPFNLNVSPLWKVSLAKVSKRQSILLINFHHLIIDGWSMQRFIHELQELYHVDGATLPNRCVPGGDMLGRYAAYCQCQSERSRGQVDLTDNGSRQRCVAMYGDLQDVNLWPDRRRPARLSSSGASTATVVNAELNQRITKLCRAIGITKASFWLATLRFYLDRRQGGNDFAIGMPTSGRDERAVVDLIGFFVGTLVLRLDNPGDNESITVVDWLRHANQQLSDAMLNPSFSVDEILTFTQPERRLDRSPLFQVLFSYAAESVKPFELGKAILRPVLPKVDQAKFEWTVSVSEMLDGSASLSLEYCTDLFFQSTAQAVVRQLVETADVLVHQQQSLLRTLSIRESSSKHDEEIIRPVRAFSSAFGEHVSGSPESIAIEDGQAKLTYRQLEQRSRSLRSVGAGDVPVQIATDRSVESLIELIRCLRANAPFVLTDRMITKNLAHHSSTLDDAACVALTSGTQGIPKGVVIRRDSLDRHNEAFVRLLNLSTTDRVTQYGSAEFDLYLEEVLPTLRAGATLCLVPEDCRLDPMAFTKWVIENAITVVDLPTAFFHRWAESIVSLPHFPNLRAVVVGGERLDRDLATGFVAAFPLIDLWNSYGPTEATIICTAHKVSAMEDHAEVPIGIPFAGAKLLVVDSAGTRVPSGCPGELVIAGIGLANGYLKAEELGRGNGFRRHPEDPSRIAYWTGDRVRVDQSGVFHFLGRLDDQIKVRGVRVYLNDVAERIRKHAAVAAVAVVCEMDAASPTLVAAVVLKDALNPNVAIRRELATALPASMRPSQWCFCEAIPMTNRGKVDRRAIMNLALSSTSETLGSEATAEWDGEPQTQLAAIWEALLGHRDFTADDDFFLVGGHSLMAAMLVREIELAFDAKVALSRIFETPTIHALAKLIGPADQVTSKTEQAPRSNMLHRPCKDPFANTVSVLLPGLPGVSQVYEPLVTKLSERSEAFAFSIPGIDGRESIPESIDKLSDRWAFELTSVLRSNETPLQIFAHSFAASVLYRMLCNHRPWCERIERCVLIDAMPHRPIDWTAESRWMAGTPMTPEITGLNHQTRAALAMLLRSSSIESGEPLPMDIEFVIASQSRAWIDDRAWDSFFRSVRQVDCEGDHASLVQLQHCDAWL